MSQSSRTLIVSDGGIASLVACAVAKETAAIDGRMQAGTCILPCSRIWGGAMSSPNLRQKATLLQAEVFGYECWEPLTGVTAGAEPLPGTLEVRERETLELLAAAELAVRKGCDTVVWPVQCVGPSPDRDEDGLDLDWIARAADKAVLVSRLVATDADAHHKPGIRIETPYLDVTDHQLADLAAEMELPMRTCWWWSITRRDGEQAMAERERWLRALAFVGWHAPAA